MRAYLKLHDFLSCYVLTSRRTRRWQRADDEVVDGRRAAWLIPQLMRMGGSSDHAIAREMVGLGPHADSRDLERALAASLRARAGSLILIRSRRRLYAGGGPSPVAELEPSDEPVENEILKVEKTYSLHVRLEIDPQQATHHDDRFTLIGGDQLDSPQYRKVATVKDDQVPGDTWVDLIFADLVPDVSYWLEIDPGAEGEPYFVFEDAGWGQVRSVARS